MFRAAGLWLYFLDQFISAVVISFISFCIRIYTRSFCFYVCERSLAFVRSWNVEVSFSSSGCFLFINEAPSFRIYSWGICILYIKPPFFGYPTQMTAIWTTDNGVLYPRLSLHDILWTTSNKNLLLEHTAFPLSSLRVSKFRGWDTTSNSSDDSIFFFSFQWQIDLSFSFQICIQSTLIV